MDRLLHDFRTPPPSDVLSLASDEVRSFSSSLHTTPTAPPLLSGADAFDEATGVLIQQLHEAWRSNAPVSTYADIRDRLLAEHDRVGTRIATLSAVTRIACPYALDSDEDCLDPVWRDFFVLADSLDNAADDSLSLSSSTPRPPKRTRTNNEAVRLRNLAIVAALWSPEVVRRYDWVDVGQSQMKAIRACAVAYPHFREEFCPRLNAVLLHRHCSALVTGRGKTINEARLQPSRDFDLFQLASLPIDAQLESLWLTSIDGSIPVDDKGTLLKHIRPRHFHLYLLSKDEYGMFDVRPEGNTPSSSSELPLLVPSISASSASTPSSDGGFMQQSPTTIEGWLGNDEYDGLDFNMLCPTPISHENDIAIMEPSLEMLPGSQLALDLQMQDLITQAGGSFRNVLGKGLNATPATRRSQKARKGSKKRCITDKRGITKPLCPSGTQPKKHSRLVIGERLPVNLDVTSQSLEETLHGAYQNHLRSYVESWSRDVTSSGSPEIGGNFSTKWMTLDTEWARVWTPTGSELLSGRATRGEDAEVLYYLSHEFMKASNSGERFRTPIVIKETFADTGMHTVDGFVSLAQDAFRNTAVGIVSEVARENATTDAYDGSSLTLTQAGQTSVGLKDLTVRNVTRAHRPQLTMLRRFRLLENLAERHRYRREHGRQSSNPSVRYVESCPGFNTLSLPGANPIPRVDALSGAWMRVLQGTVFYVFVPDDELRSDHLLWQSFANSEADAATWDPSGKQRLIVLEKDDVLLIPPGLRIARVIHSPTGCLIEGGTLWDDHAIVDTLQSIYWSWQGRPMVDERLRRDLFRIFTELEEFVHEQPERFQGSMRPEDFDAAFSAAMKQVKPLFLEAD